MPKVKDVAEPESNRLEMKLSRNYVVEGDLCCEVSQIIQQLIDINCYAVACRGRGRGARKKQRRRK
jgi:ribosomal protein S13